ncbi:hypothetical protein [Paractinoplanes rishiriensis]|uniref:Uncharacterized protein n=1 Tax=Paractinoplanes rishiriensis TaxID=1050105 RepID=A0A919MRP8_9ACTN|nr:hypothetical protein [Actinoplanes rishiriensis]GIE92813.1 hypothetical protein Ari01nite_02780 [Actinoplanes rishiriensis]
MDDQFHVETTRNKDETAVVLECWERVDVNRWSTGREDKIKLAILSDQDAHDKVVLAAAEHLISAARHRAEARSNGA